MAELIEGELDEASGISELERLDRRIEFIEDRFEELEADCTAVHGGAGSDGQPLRFLPAGDRGRRLGRLNGPAGRSVQCRRSLRDPRLEEGSSYTAVTKAFRKKVKELHPDARAGDRSGEVQLRKLIAAISTSSRFTNWGGTHHLLAGRLAVKRSALRTRAPIIR